MENKDIKMNIIFKCNYINSNIPFKLNNISIINFNNNTNTINSFSTKNASTNESDSEIMVIIIMKMNIKK